MSLFAASAWVFGATFAWQLLGALLMTRHDSQRGDIVTLALCQLIVFLMALFGILRVHAPDARIRDVVAFRSTSALFFPLAAVFGIAASVPAGALYDFIVQRFPVGESPSLLQQTFVEASVAKKVVMSFVVALSGPVIEEVIFRGAILGQLRTTLSRRSAIVCSSLLFAMAHISWQLVVPIFLLGLCLGWLREWSGSLVVPALSHASFNAVALVSLATPQPETQESTPIAYLIIPTLIAAVALMLSRVIGERSEAAQQARELDQ